MKIVPIFSSPAGAGGPILNYLWDVRVTRSCARVTMIHVQLMILLSIDGYLLLSLDNYYACEISNSPRTTKKGPCSKLRSLAGSFITRSRSAKFKSPESQISQKSSTFKIHEPVFPMTMTMTRHNSRGTCVLQIAIYVEYRRSRKSCIVALWILRALFDKPCIETTGSDKSYYSTCFFQF